jgi:hypothetical protein
LGQLIIYLKNYIMKNLKLFTLLLFTIIIIAGCKKDYVPSGVQTVSYETVAENFVETQYIHIIDFTPTSIYDIFPDTLGLLVDSVYGYPNGFGGHTGKDSLYLVKESDIDWPDTTQSGAYPLTFYSTNLGGYNSTIKTTLIIVSPLPEGEEGPTDLAGEYKRTSNGAIIDITYIANGIYGITNLGGSGSGDGGSYLLFNYLSSTATDSLVFPVQLQSCGNGVKLVAPFAPYEKTVQAYDALFPPSVTSLSPVTLSWRVFEFPNTESSAKQPGNGLAYCWWGTQVRTFEKQ